MHVLRLQSCDTFWVLIYGISVERVVCVCVFFFCTVLISFRCCDISSSNRKATVSCTSDFVGTIQYSLFIQRQLQIRFLSLSLSRCIAFYAVACSENTMNMHASCGQSLIGSTEHRLNVAAGWVLRCHCINGFLSGKHRPPSMPFVVVTIVIVVFIVVGNEQLQEIMEIMQQILKQAINFHKSEIPFSFNFLKSHSALSIFVFIEHC